MTTTLPLARRDGADIGRWLRHLHADPTSADDWAVRAAGSIEAYAAAMAIHDALERVDGQPAFWLTNELLTQSLWTTCRVGLRHEQGEPCVDPNTLGRHCPPDIREAVLLASEQWGDPGDLLDIRFHRQPGGGWRTTTWRVEQWEPATDAYLVRWPD